MGWSLYKSIRHLTTACDTLTRHCVQGLEANRPLLEQRVRESITVVTALNPVIGYERAALLAKTAIATGQSFQETAQQLRILDAQQIEALLVPEKLTQPTAGPL
jgi:aspartate ammonia-lyase